MPTKPKTLRLANYYEKRTYRKEDKAFYDSAHWKRMRNLVRAEEPLCRECMAQGRIVPTAHIDHIIGRKLRPDLAFERSNLQGLCRRCHTLKTRREGQVTGWVATVEWSNQEGGAASNV